MDLDSGSQANSETFSFQLPVGRDFVQIMPVIPGHQTANLDNAQISGEEPSDFEALLAQYAAIEAGVKVNTGQPEGALEVPQTVSDGQSENQGEDEDFDRRAFLVCAIGLGASAVVVYALGWLAQLLSQGSSLRQQTGLAAKGFCPSGNGADSVLNRLQFASQTRISLETNGYDFGQLTPQPDFNPYRAHTLPLALVSRGGGLEIIGNGSYVFTERAGPIFLTTLELAHQAWRFRKRADTCVVVPGSTDSRVTYVNAVRGKNTQPIGIIPLGESPGIDACWQFEPYYEDDDNKRVVGLAIARMPDLGVVEPLPIPHPEYYTDVIDVRYGGYNDAEFRAYVGQSPFAVAAQDGQVLHVPIGTSEADSKHWPFGVPWDRHAHGRGVLGKDREGNSIVVGALDGFDRRYPKKLRGGNRPGLIPFTPDILERLHS